MVFEGRKGRRWMENRFGIRGFVAVFIAVCWLCLAGYPVWAAEEDATVRVGVYDNSIYAYKDEKGVWRGTDIECLTNIAQRAGFKVTFIGSSTDPDFMGSLDNGTYDIVTNVVKTPEREENYLFNDDALGTTDATLAVRADDDRWEYGNIEQVSRMKVGVVASYAYNAAFRSWSTAHGVTLQIIEYPSIDQMGAALAGNQIDAEVYAATYDISGTKTTRSVLQFMPEAFYYAFRKDDMALKNKVDAAMSRIIIENPDYLVNLKNKYSTQLNIVNQPLTSEEKTYISAHPTIKVAVIKDDQPYYAKVSGKDDGIIPDYFALLAEHTGVKFSYSSYTSQEEAIRAVKDGKADVLAMFSNGLISASQNDLTLTDLYSETAGVLVTKSVADGSSIKRVAVKARDMETVEGTVSGDISKAEFTGCDNASEVFQKLNQGAVDGAVLGLPSATWVLSQTNSAAYSITPLTGLSIEQCGAVKSENRTLCGILNKSIAATKGSYSGIVANNTLPDNNWRTLVSSTSPTVIAFITCALTALVLGLIWALAKLHRRERERSAVLAAQAETERQKLQVEAMQKSTEERNQFFSNISHDMRTPLNAIIGFSDLAQEKAAVPEVKDYLGKIQQSGNLLLGLINDTLTISKMSSGKLELRPEPVETTELTRSLSVAITPAAQEKGVLFTVDDSRMRPRIILADQLNLQKIFLNLLSNAVKFTPEGGHVWFILEDNPAGGDDPDIIITVKDDGIGMTEAYQTHVFEPFTQEKRPGYEAMGTGLGLSIVKELVNLMGGTITMHSEVEKGTEYNVCLHFPEVQGDGKESHVRIETSEQQSLAGKKILLCEDNHLNREIAVALLKHEGVEVITAENGQEGLAAFMDSAPGEYAAILMDLRMPVMDGYAATAAIRSAGRPDAAAVPIIAMTADAFADDIQKCLDAGMNAHVAKPIDPGKLYGTLRAAIQGRETLEEE